MGTPLTRRSAFWLILAVAAAGATLTGVRYFPDAFSIVALDITMDRAQALDQARAIMTRDRRGPSGYRQAASFGGDDEAQYFVELEGGGKDVLTAMLREGLYASYTWRVRHFKEGEANETTIRFTPDGRPYGFVERLKEDAPGAALDPGAARQIAEKEAAASWGADFGRFSPVEQGQERRTSGRVDHTFTYERASPTLNDGRYRLRLVVSGDRLTEVTHFIQVPEAFTRRYASMRAANEAIGYGSIIGMAVYVFVGIGAGLFVMLRQRRVVWRPAAYWGTAVGLLQALAAVNDFPLLWVSYDTALPEGTFIASQVATILAMFLGYSAFFALTFMAAETLGRRAFGAHPQLWRVWSKGPGSSKAVLGRTAAGYLLVALFFAYDVVLYVVMTRRFGWWSPSEALLTPDVLASYVPALSAIANSFQAGFWEESLFRAVPLAGAALIGDRFGKRNLFLVVAFIVQAIVFGAGHAPYPNQPSYARPVELILPSIGFGLLYVYWGLLPGIILHFTFDVVWFALPIFLARAPGIWIQQALIVVLTLVPLWIVLWRRAQAGQWTELAPDERNAAWTPPPPPEPIVEAVVQPHDTLTARAETVWLGLGVVSLVACLVAGYSSPPSGTLTIERHQAEEAVRGALERRGVSLQSRWRVMPLPDSGSGGPHEFVSETAGEERRRQLLGTYLPAPRWNVRVASFEGDVAERAEEWQAFVTAGGEVRPPNHTLPEGRPGASLEEDAARRLAMTALTERLRPAAGGAGMKEVSAIPVKLKARTDWTFTFVDTTVPALPQGEPRVAVEISGDEVTSARRFVFVPENWQRVARASETRNALLQIPVILVFGTVLTAAGVFGIIAWSRREYAPRLFFASAGVMLVVSAARAINQWPSLIASQPTAAPLAVSLLGTIGLGLVGLIVVSAIVGLPLGHAGAHRALARRLPVTDARRLAVAAGLVATGAGALSSWLMTPAWAKFPNVEPLGTLVPVLQAALNPIVPMLLQTAALLAACLGLDRLTSSWSRRRIVAIAAMAVIGFLSTGTPVGEHLGGWAAGSLVSAATLALLYAALIRFDLSMLPLTVATASALETVAKGAQRPFPGALVGSALGAVLMLLVGWWLFRALRRGNAASESRGM